jgi:aminopeptidase-like protein
MRSTWLPAGPAKGQIVLLASLLEPARAAGVAGDAMQVASSLFPICRSITGNGVRLTLKHIESLIPLERFEVPTGTQLFDWEVPREWNIRDAYISDGHGQRVVDYRANNLHVVNYSVPVRRTMTLDELQPHLYSLPEQPDWIPYRTSYYREHWGFCLRHRDRERLGPGPYEVVIDSDLAPGHLTYAECPIAGTTEGEAVVYTHTCHPSLANDNLSGIALAAVLARELRQQQPRLTWRFVFGPGTIGSLSWLSRNERRLSRLRCGLVIGLLGDAGPLTYKRSRSGATMTDRAVEYVLGSGGYASQVIDFEPYGYDERQFCSPGFDLPVGRLTRSANGTYPEYHTSADDLSLLKVDRLEESLQVLARTIAVLDANCHPVNLSPKGEPRLGKRGLYGSLGGTAPREFEQALLWVLSLADGTHDLIAMAARSGLSFEVLDRAVSALQAVGLVRIDGESLKEGEASRS